MNTLGADEDYALSLVNLCNSVLESVVSTFDYYKVDLPERQYVTTGQVAYDCEQVVVSFAQLYLGPPGEQATRPQRCNAPRTAFLNVHVVRSVPEPGRTGPPSAESLHSSAEIKLVDAFLLMKAGADVVDGCGVGVLADVSVSEPGGGVQGTILNVTLAVP